MYTVTCQYSYRVHNMNSLRYYPRHNPIYSPNSGFTLIELSVVLAIIGVILYGSMSLLVVSIQSSQVNTTVATMDAIENALLNFRVAFGRIPCPADLTLSASNANYGVEAANTGSCTGGTPAANFIAASGTAEGGVPTRALRLPDSYMYDGWGHKLRYAMNPNYSVSTSTTCSLGAVSAPAITINDASGAARSTQAIYAIISHGANGHGAYTSNGLVINAKNTNTDEQTNCHCDNTGAHTGGAGVLSPATYVQKAPTMSTAGTLLTTFDDIVAYKEAWQLMTTSLPTNSLGCTFTQYTRAITIDHTKVGTVNNTDQSSFPVLFSGTYTYLKTVANGGNVNNANGYDIYFSSDAAGNSLLPFERESWNASTGASVFWVQVATVSHSSDTVIYLQYGNPTISTDKSNKTGTWNTNYVGVWHLAETSGTTNADSTTNVLNTTKVSATHPNPATSIIGGGGQYNNAGYNHLGTDYNTLADNSKLDFGANQNFTVSAWVKNSQTAISNYWPFPVSKDDLGSSGTRQGYNLVMFDTSWGNNYWFFEIWQASSNYRAYGSSSVSDGNWHYIVGSRSGSTLYAFQDGVQTAAQSGAGYNGTLSNPIPLEFGDCSNCNANGTKDRNYIGGLDEVRISKTALSADWVKTEYNNQGWPDKATTPSPIPSGLTSGFYTVGSATR